MSKLRPTLRNSNEPGLCYSATYYRVLEAVAKRRSLIHGRLNDYNGHYCAIGSYFEESKIPIDSKAIDEIAAYNDSFPKLSPKERWRKVQSWLRFRIQVLGGKAKSTPLSPVTNRRRGREQT